MGRRTDPGLDRQLTEARALFRRGSLASALRELMTAQSRDPARPEVHRLLGLCYARQGRPEEACEALRQALRLDPLDFVARGALGVLLSQNGDPAIAIEELERGIAVLRDGAAAAYEEGRAMVESGRLPDALAMLRRAGWLRLVGAVLQHSLNELFCDHCLLELAFREWESEDPMFGNRSCGR